MALIFAVTTVILVIAAYFFGQVVILYNMKKKSEDYVKRMENIRTELDNSIKDYFKKNGKSK